MELDTAKLSQKILFIAETFIADNCYIGHNFFGSAGKVQAKFISL